MNDTPTSATTAVPSADATQAGAEIATAPISAHHQRLAELSLQLVAASDRKRAMLSKADTLRRAGEAAKADASSIRQQWRDKLRDGDGTLTRQIQKLRATERSALSLADEYESLAAEVIAPLPALELELAELAHRCNSFRDGIVQKAAPLALEQALALAGDSVAVALDLFCRAANVGVHHRQASSEAELTTRFFANMAAAVRTRIDTPAVREQVRQNVALPALDFSQVDMALAQSPTKRSIARRQLQQDVAT